MELRFCTNLYFIVTNVKLQLTDGMKKWQVIVLVGQIWGVIVRKVEIYIRLLCL